MASRQFLGSLGSLFVRSCFSLRFLIVFGSVWARFGVPKWGPKSDWIAGGATPGGVPGQPWSRLDAPLGSTCGLGSFLRLLWSFLGPFWASSGAIFGLLGASFTVFLRCIT